MITQWSFFIVVLIANAVLATAIAVLLKRRQIAPGRDAMVWMLFALAIWAFGYAMITVFPALAAKLFWLRVENLGILSVPIFWFFFTVQYAQVDRWLNRYTGALFFIIPAISMIFILSEAWFPLYYAAVRPVSELGGPLIIERGPWYWVSAMYAYALNLIGLGILIWRFVNYRNIYRRQLYILVAAVLIPVAVNLFYQFAPSIFPALSDQIDLTPISFTITAFLLSAGVFGFRLFDLIPIARHRVLEHIPEMVFVVDAHDRVLDANPAAQKALGKSLEEIIGRDPLEVFREWPQLINRFLTTDETREEIQIPGDPPRTLEIFVSPLYSQHLLEGRVIVAYDITEHKWLENDLKYANDSLRVQLNEIEELRAELEQQAIRDPLTNAYNRRYLTEFLEKELVKAERERTPVTVMILDVDNFKMFNDSYGHKCGDMVLQFITKFLVEHSRRGEDVVCRYGGEEFVILLPHVSLDVGFERADAWRQDFSETPIYFDGLELLATFSVGVATYPQHGLTVEAILQAADKALLQSKDAGKNRVTQFGSFT